MLNLTLSIGYKEMAESTFYQIYLTMLIMLAC